MIVAHHHHHHHQSHHHQEANDDDDRQKRVVKESKTKKQQEEGQASKSGNSDDDPLNKVIAVAVATKAIRPSFLFARTVADIGGHEPPIFLSFGYSQELGLALCSCVDPGFHTLQIRESLAATVSFSFHSSSKNCSL